MWLPLLAEVEPAAPRRIRLFGSVTESTACQLEFRSASGEVLGTRAAELPRGGELDVPVPPTLSGVVPAVAEIACTGAASARMEVAAAADSWSFEALRVRDAAAPGSKLIQPHLEWFGIFTSRIFVVNTTKDRASIRLRLRSPDGSPVAADTSFDIQPGGTISGPLESMMRLNSQTPQGSGWMELEVSDGGVAAAVLALDPLSGAAAAATMRTAQSGVWSLPLFVENASNYTGLALATPGAFPANITITAFDREGRVLTQVETTLEPGHSRTALTAQWLPELPSEVSGHIAITSSSPIGLLSYFGTDDGASLAAIPLKRKSP